MRVIWERRALAAAERERERLEKLSAYERAKIARGKMPHWSTYKNREKDGEQMRGTMIHVLRPDQEADSRSNNHTLCGWHQVSFRSSTVHRLPRHELYAGMSSVRDFLVLGDRVSCPHCFDVMDNIASWISMTEVKREGGFYHLAWDRNHYRPACDIDVKLSIGTQHVNEFANTIANKGQCCATCIAIFGVLWGRDRPENAFASYTTNEEASAARSKR